MLSKSRPGLAIAVAIVVTAASGLTVLLTPSAAQALDSHCQPQPNGQVLCVWNASEATNSPFTFTPPPGFTSAQADLFGGGGGDGGGGALGGAGGSAHGSIPVRAADLPWTIIIGEAGDTPSCSDEGADGGATTGGPGGGGNCPGGGGGGGTFVLAHSTGEGGADPADESVAPLGAAGGGGGGSGGAPNGGAGGGDTGAPGEPAGNGGGGGGTQTQGGAGGANPAPGFNAGFPGGKGNGGSGATGSAGACGTACDAGGGGGGGFYGGGGGASESGGGGGSGCILCELPSDDPQSTAVNGAAGSNTSGPVFHMAQNNGSVMLLFGNAMTPPGQTPNGRNGPRTGPNHHAGNNNDPNPNTNPTQRSADRVTTTTVCEPRIGVCKIGPIVGPDSVFNVTATGGANRAVLYGTLQGGLKPDCPNYTEMNSDWLDFGFTNRVEGSTWRKATSLMTRHKMTRAAALALSRTMQICFEAPYRFPTRPGYDLGSARNLFDGVLPDCGVAASGRGTQNPCVEARQVLQRKGGWVVRFLFRVPANSKDPKALG